MPPRLLQGRLPSSWFHLAQPAPAGDAPPRAQGHRGEAGCHLGSGAFPGPSARLQGASG